MDGIAPNGVELATISSASNTPNNPYGQLIEIWLKSTRSQRDTTKEAYAKTLAEFAAFVQNKPLNEISRKDVIAFRDYVLSQGKSAVTAASKVGILRTFFRGAHNYELMATNPALDIRSNAPHIEKARIAFSADDLRRIFNCPIYTEQYRPISGGKEAAYWLPLLALFTGARVEELAQLMVRDIREAPSLGYFINISDEAAHAHLKNNNSRRRIPVHELLIACGFLDYVTRQKKTGMLFPDLKQNNRGKFAGYFSYFFSHYLREKIGITDERKVFHSFRHTFKDLCRHCGIEEAVHDALTGHGKSSAGRNYGNEQYPLEPLFEAMARYQVPDLDLAHLLVRPISNHLNRATIKPVSAFYGLIMAFAGSIKKRDSNPYVLVLHEGKDMAMEIDSLKLTYGYLPDEKLLLAQAWVSLHREELLANWHLGKTTGEYFKVVPLQ